ncbi:hypothetical protein BDDG_13506, partial [Blastomyces dermatitidis ATCC 18188]
SSHIDRFTFTDDSEPDVKSLIKNLKNVIMKKLSVSCMIRFSVFLPSLSVSFSVTLSQSSTSAPVSSSPAPATSVPATLTSATSGFTISAFVISSPQFKEILYRLNESHLSRITSLFNSVKIINIYIFRNENADVVLFYIHRYET